MQKFSDLDMYYFGEGTHYDIYKKMGSHLTKENGKNGVQFTVWAPHAEKVFVIGSFNNWDEEKDEMERVEPQERGVYELFIPEAKEGDLYKYMIVTSEGEKLYKADPYANAFEKRPGTASKIVDITKFRWSDSKWMQKREETNGYEKPMAIYEVHPGSWKRHPNREDEGFYSYQQFAESLTEYVLDMGYTHVELMGISEYPFDASWGYQVTGYYAPTSRYGSPADFAYLVNYLHQHNIGVILDWVPAHFPKDASGLAEFDGKPLYEYPDPRMGEHPDWGTKIFNYGMGEVKNFLIGSALMWIEQYHVDGLRVDAVASMLYLDYGKQDGDWVRNQYGENKNLEAIEFFRHINTVVTGRNPGAVMIAEESTAWPDVTRPANEGGLNFSYKWNMGWMHDFIDYMSLDPYFRKDNHNRMTFAMSYNYAENYILVLSHDEVVHLKCSMINKMPGLGKEKFDNLKAAYAFFIGHPGKKLLFMGQDFAQLREWSEERELDWYLLAQPEHQQIQNFMRELLHIYQKYPAMYQWDRGQDGFEWINANDAEHSIFSFVRKGASGDNLLFVINFTPVAREDYRVGVPYPSTYKLIFSSEEARFGGSGVKQQQTYKAKEEEWDGREYSIGYKLPAYGVAIFSFDRTPDVVEKKKKSIPVKTQSSESKQQQKSIPVQQQQKAAPAKAQQSVTGKSAPKRKRALKRVHREKE
ncbi:MAG: 1,4-alpha-glucan branching protein GlgB [Lachnospiraceae bacterium]